MIGDDLDEDYLAAKSSGLHAVLLTRRRNEADYVRREAAEGELEGVGTIDGMDALPIWIERYNDDK